LHTVLSLFQPCSIHPALHPFPTRRSSDLGVTQGADGNALLAQGSHIRLALLNMFGVALKPQPPVRQAAAVFTSAQARAANGALGDRKSTRLNSSHVKTSYAVLSLKKKNSS